MTREMRQEYNKLYELHAGAKSQRIEWMEKLASDLMKSMTEWTAAQPPDPSVAPKNSKSR